jgi:hypothetical protein
MTTSQRESPVVEDYNLAAGGRRGMTQLRIDTGFWTQKGKNAKEAIGKAWSKSNDANKVVYVNYNLRLRLEEVSSPLMREEGDFIYCYSTMRVG